MFVALLATGKNRPRQITNAQLLVVTKLSSRRFLGTDD